MRRHWPSRGAHKTAALWTFQAGRPIGYGALGAVAAASLQCVGWLSTQSAALRPVWTLFHVAAMVLGLALVWRARQPVWLEAFARQVWGRVRRAFNASWGRGAPLAIGALWAFLQCGLLYSALLVAALTSRALDGAAVMALFALGSSVPLMAGPWLLLRVGGGSRQWGIRLAGIALATTSGWALWMGLVHNTAPWCLTA